MIRKSGYRFSEKIMLKTKWRGRAHQANDGDDLGVAKTETGPGLPVELADLRPKVVFNLGAESSLIDNIRQPRKSGPGKKTGHDKCESNGATPLPASHPMQGLISG
jgi:hypothetical protein